jgi:hypothetical protein
MHGESRGNVYYACKEAVHGGDQAGEKVLDISHMAPKHPCGQETIDASKTRSEGGERVGGGEQDTHTNT